MYTTCSVELEENENVVTEFAGKNRKFVPFSFDTNRDLLTDQGFMRLWPHRQDTDGFFIAGFHRVR